jgi:hypothetical protein
VKNDKYVIRKPTLSDLKFLSDNVRDDDRKEALIFTNLHIDEIFKITPNILEESFVWEVDNKLIAMYGIARWDNHNIIWLLATNEFDKYKIIFRKDCKKVFNEMMKKERHVYNYVLAESKKVVRWLEWLGFTVYAPEPMGVNGELFCNFEFLKENV